MSGRRSSSSMKIPYSYSLGLRRYLGRPRRSITSRGFEIRQSKSANGADTARMCLAAPLIALGLILWFENLVRYNGGRLKKTTIVALAFELLVALWK
ncbi:hypothetical protein SAMN04488498_1696 [Mesorhizobium albiziae]|uniref:Uncharacterized protein n=1 Tax=Neomesorhizobium albiziae TaxID=335020 RepID=A0A1I4G0F8_9HYPH|nr:hypothetical protein SAMN04488498_1696 [Mesorhizobium albiziae]